jgi:hypothetical protein
MIDKNNLIGIITERGYFFVYGKYSYECYLNIISTRIC